MIAKRIVYHLLSVLLAASLSGYFFYGVGSDRQALKYTSIISEANEAATSKYLEREAELIRQANDRVEKVLAIERRRKPKEKEIVRYVTHDKESDGSGCAVTNNGLQLITEYIDASFSSED